MARILDYHCSYDNASALGQWAEHNPKLHFPQAYEQRELMAELAQTIRRQEGTAYCLLPFCHTLEAEAMGAHILLGDGLTGPRARDYCCGSLQEVTERCLDFSSPRLQETLLVCRLLKERGESLLFQLSGPLTILNSLLPAELLYRALRKEPEQLLALCRRIGEELLPLAKAAEEAGADLLSYADPMAAVSLIGPKGAELLTKGFTLDFLKQLDRELKKETLVLLCPKTAFALLGTELAQWQEHPLEQAMHYGEAALHLRGKLRFGGQSCVKRTDYQTKEFKELILT